MTENNTEQNTELTLGEVLQQKRLELRISVQDAASYLRIKTYDIDSIESNKFDSVTKHLYILGLIRAYAKFLKVEPTIIEKGIKSVFVRSNVDNKEHKLLNIGEHIDLVPEKDMFFNFLLISVLLFFIFLSIVGSYEKSETLLSSSKVISEMEKITSQND